MQLKDYFNHKMHSLHLIYLHNEKFKNSIYNTISQRNDKSQPQMSNRNRFLFIYHIDRCIIIIRIQCIIVMLTSSLVHFFSC